MKISFEKKIFLGFVINILVIIAAGWVFISRLDQNRNKAMDSKLEWIEVSLLILSITLLVVVYFIIRSQLKAKTTSQKALYDNQQLLQSIIDNTSNPIFIKKINGEYLLINKQFGAFFDITNEKIIGKTDHDFLQESVADAYRNSDIEVVKKLRELKTEETIQQKDGPHTYIAVKFPLYDSSGRIYAIGGISTDITERKKMEKSLIASDKFFNMSAEMMIIASSTRFTKVNPATIKILGFPEEELLSQPFLNFVYEEDKNDTKIEVSKLESSSNTTQFKNRWVCKDGSIKWLVWSAIAEPTTGLMYAVARDITELDKLEREQHLAMDDLYENEEKLRLILENIGEGVIVANADKQVVLANYVANEIFGIEKDDLISPSISDHFELYFPDEKTIFPSQNMPMERALNGEVTNDVDVVLWNATNREKKRVLISGRPLLDLEHNVVAAVVTIKDISKYKHLEEELKATESKYRQLIGFKKVEEKKEEKKEGNFNQKGSNLRS